MLEKRDYRAVPGVKAADVWPKVWGWWQQAGFAVYTVGPNHLTGASYYSKIGLRREIEVRLNEANDSLYVDIAFRARITNEGAIGGAAAAVLFWPVAVVGGAFSWSEYENDANGLLANFWHFLYQTTGRPSQILFVTAPPFGTPYAVTPPPPAPTGRACSKCGAGLQPGWRVCPLCGQPVA
ncbi:MAG: hypothetical protein A3K65_09055 [Euryarchaeota archaeon RBG_16_68_12]|nr:MAG: hypothetical protein A3K65_09055 [Euryarchaeota archaeon RBG_16_68_12]